MLRHSPRAINSGRVGANPPTNRAAGASRPAMKLDPGAASPRKDIFCS